MNGTDNTEDVPAEEFNPFVELLLDAIQGVGFPSHEVGVNAEQNGFAFWTGTQHKDAWSWNRTALAELGEEQLRDLYQGLKERQYAH